jgi:hypothetical protein
MKMCIFPFKGRVVIIFNPLDELSLVHSFHQLAMSAGQQALRCSGLQKLYQQFPAKSRYMQENPAYLADTVPGRDDRDQADPG